MNFARQALRLRHFHFSASLRSQRIYEPPYLEAMKPKVPIYDLLNIQLFGYDFAVLENYQKFVHNMASNMNFDVEDCWATPAQEIQVTTLKPNSEIPNAQYHLRTYQRTVQIADVVASQLPLLLRALDASAPSGVTVRVQEHQDWDEQVRYVPDTELKALKQELDDMGGPSTKKRN